MNGERLRELVERAQRRRAMDAGLQALALGSSAGFATLIAGLLEGRSLHETGLARLGGAAAIAALAVGCAWLAAGSRGPRAALRALERAGRGVEDGITDTKPGELSTAWELAVAQSSASEPATGVGALLVAECEARCDVGRVLSRLPRLTPVWLVVPLLCAALFAFLLERGASNGASPEAGGPRRQAVIAALSGVPGRGEDAVLDTQTAWVLALADALDVADRSFADRDVGREADRDTPDADGADPDAVDPGAPERARLEAELDRALEALSHAARDQGLAQPGAEGTMSGSLTEVAQPETPLGDPPSDSLSPETRPHDSPGLVRGRSWPAEYDAIVTGWLARRGAPLDDPGPPR